MCWDGKEESKTRISLDFFVISSESNWFCIGRREIFHIIILEMSEQMYVYILTNQSHRVFYTGVTNNLERIFPPMITLLITTFINEAHSFIGTFYINMMTVFCNIYNMWIEFWLLVLFWQPIWMFGKTNLAWLLLHSIDWSYSIFLSYNNTMSVSHFS